MKKLLIGSVAALAVAAPISLVAATPAEATTLYYSSCAKLTVKYHHGVAKGRTAALRQVGQGYGMPAYGTLAQKVYWENHARLDRDNDGTACER